MPRSVFAVLVLTSVAAASPLAGEELAPGVEFLPGRFVAGTQPDGNTVVLQGSSGLIVVDTGRHAGHTQGILDLATRLHAPIAAVINTHWHLDHIGGNPRIRRAHPAARVWASGALAQAQVGFLAAYRGQLQSMIEQTTEPAARRTFQDEVALIDAGPALAPDEVVAAAGPRTVAGRALELGLEGPAVTAGDLWVLDNATGVLAAGDLVTLPVPLLDTACPQGWQAALARLATVKFTTLVPGHGRPMTRPQFDAYRAAFDALLACAASARPEQACSDGWMRDAGTLIPESDRELALMLLKYYLPSSLRAAPEKLARLCGS